MRALTTSERSEQPRRRIRELLETDEEKAPAAVEQTVRFLTERGVWHVLSRNRPALGCRDAAHKRLRLGHVGIPLWDEMKSFFGRVEGDDGVLRYVMAHCRADRRLDLARLAAAVGASTSPERLAHDDLALFGLAYGLINPFETWQPYALDGRVLHAPVLQVFDADLLEPLGSPGTVMTNAGDLTWAVELRPGELFAALDQDTPEAPSPGVLRAQITAPDPGCPPRPPHLTGRRSIAILTGNAPESGIAVWQKVNDFVRELLGKENTGDSSMPPVRVISLPELGMTMELNGRAEDVWAKLAPAIAELCATDTAILAIACNTTQYFVERIRALTDPAGVEFVCLPEVVAAWLQAQQVRDVALVGIPYVADLAAGWSAYAEPLREFHVEELDERTFAQLIELAYRVKEEGATEGGLNKLRSILNHGVQSSHVVLALTELSMLLARQRRTGRSGKTMVDPLSLYAECLARRWLGLRFPAPPAGWSAQLTGLTHHGRRVAKGDSGRPHNEDAVLLARRVISLPSPAESRTAPVPHQEVSALGSGGTRCEPVAVAVADGLGGHVAGEKASRFVLTRIRDAAGRMRDPDAVTAVLRELSDALHEEAVRAGDPVNLSRGATVGGLALLPAGFGDGDLEAVWFSVGDCVLLRITSSDRDGASIDVLCDPAATPDGHPNRVLGLPPFSVACDTMHIAGDTVFLCCTDGFPTSFGIEPHDRHLAAKLAEHPALRPLWMNMVRGPGDPEADRAAVGELLAAARDAWPLEQEKTLVPDNLSLAMVRVMRDPATTGDTRETDEGERADQRTTEPR